MGWSLVTNNFAGEELSIVALTAYLLRSVVPVVHPVVACDLLILRVDHSLVEAGEGRVFGAVLTQFVDQVFLLYKGCSSTNIHGNLHAPIFDRPTGCGRINHDA
jgi:hypothetical protein